MKPYENELNTQLKSCSAVHEAPMQTLQHPCKALIQCFMNLPIETR